MSGNNIPWIVVVIALVVFWPVGLFLLFRKLSTDKSATIKSGKLLSTVSFILIGVGLIWGLSAIAGDSSLFVPAALTLCGGVWLRGIAKKTKARGERYKKYIALVVNQRLSSIDQIASATNITYDVALNDLKKMVETGYFPGAYIDFDGRSIIMPQQPEYGTASSSTSLQTRVVTCKSCGANNSVSGALGECEYCGSPLA